MGDSSSAIEAETSTHNSRYPFRKVKMICKKCKKDISGDCVLTGRPDVEGVCVFCHYGIDSWDSNGQLVTKDQATRGIGWWTKEDLEEQEEQNCIDLAEANMKEQEALEDNDNE